MNTFKTAVVLVTLLGVGYGVHVVLNKPLNNSYQQNAQAPLDEFGLPILDLQGVQNGVQDTVNGVVEAATNEQFGTPQILPADGATSYQNQIANAAQNVASSVSDQANGFVGQAQNAIANQADGMLGQARDAVGGLTNQATSMANQATNQVGAFVDQANGVVSQANGAMNGAVNNVANTATNYANNAQAQLQSGVAAVQNALPDLSVNSEDFPDLPSLPVASAQANVQNPRQPFANNGQVSQHAFPQNQNVVTHGNQPAMTQNLLAPQQNAQNPYAAQNLASVNLTPPNQSVGAQQPGTPMAQTGSSMVPAPSVARPYANTSAELNGARSAAADTAFANMWQSAQAKIEQGQFADALFTMSLWYSNPELTSEQREMLVPLLDQLAGKVFYSRDHQFGPPHVVQPGETLAQIAARHGVTAEFLARVNGTDRSRPLTPGQQLKVVTGPFRAELRLSSREITVFRGSYYAGRFMAGVGRDLPIGEMALEVAELSGARPYVNSDTGQSIVAGDPQNPYGNYWIGLRSPGTAVNPYIGLHSTGPGIEASDTRGCISLSDRDANDLQTILTLGSRFTIVR